MICELFKFFGALPLEFNDFESAQTIELKGEDLLSFAESVNFFVESEFEIQNPSGLTNLEKSQYFIEKTKFRLKSYKQKALIEREIGLVPEGIDLDELIKEETPKQKALDLMSRRAVKIE